MKNIILQLNCFITGHIWNCIETIYGTIYNIDVWRCERCNKIELDI